MFEKWNETEPQHQNRPDYWVAAEVVGELGISGQLSARMFEVWRAVMKLPEPHTQPHLHLHLRSLIIDRVMAALSSWCLRWLPLVNLNEVPSQSHSRSITVSWHDLLPLTHRCGLTAPIDLFPPINPATTRRRGEKIKLFSAIRRSGSIVGQSAGRIW